MPNIGLRNYCILVVNYCISVINHYILVVNYNIWVNLWIIMFISTHLLDHALDVFGNWVLSRCHAQREWDRVDPTDEDRASFMKLLPRLAVIHSSAKEFVGSIVEFAAFRLNHCHSSRFLMSLGQHFVNRMLCLWTHGHFSSVSTLTLFVVYLGLFCTRCNIVDSTLNCKF